MALSHFPWALMRVKGVGEAFHPEFLLPRRAKSRANEADEGVIFDPPLFAAGRQGGLP